MKTNDKPRRNPVAWYSKAALSALGGLAAGSATQEAQASTIVSWTSGATVDENVDFPSSYQALFFNPQTGATTLTSSFEPGVGWAYPGTQLAIIPQVIGVSHYTTMIWDTSSSGGMATLGNGPYPPKLAFGAAIGPSASFSPFTAGTPPFSPGSSSRYLLRPSSGNFGLGSTGYIGLRFGNGPSYNYGWIELITDSGGDVTLVGGGYDTTPGEVIDAGQMGSPAAVPAPSSLVMLASGALGLGVYRALRARRKLAAACHHA